MTAALSSMHNEAICLHQNRGDTAIDQEGDPRITCHRVDEAKRIASVEDSNGPE
jgi:hypothetical protein